MQRKIITTFATNNAVVRLTHSLSNFKFLIFNIIKCT